MSLFWFLVLAAAIVGIFIYRSRHSSWITVESSNGGLEGDLGAKEALLKNEGIRCRIKSPEAAAGVAVAGIPDNGSHHSGPVHLQVRSGDVERAREILSQADEALV